MNVNLLIYDDGNELLKSSKNVYVEDVVSEIERYLHTSASYNDDWGVYTIECPLSRLEGARKILFAYEGLNYDED